ncbi:major capsid protein [Pseudomonas pseudonitroreducens]|uniref:major capsid protein n=1 Tax=Pseudomonas pseudonitroreducens TaxID=2892326 RepID=UPI001F2B14B9|nr:major capsid protein [Pseudomonas pseudonitroreducens]
MQKKHILRRSLGAAAAFGVLAAQHAMADVPPAVNTAITDAGTDAGTIGGLVLVVLVGIASFKYMRRAL